ncbi:hypothetical protein PG991_014573 [Apiospora marii]|uniref:F-box domain-containing protein n=1 Tax=Apiospora marii TaxID=335849 RepID=A0ABR1R432_9PEZI
MQALPLEVVDRIVHFLAGGQVDALRKRTPEEAGGWSCLAPYAALSPQFLESVERRVWRSLDISSDHLEECAHRLSQGRRRPGYLKELRFRVDLPAVKMAEMGNYERPEETAAASEEFGLHVRRLFDMLHRLERHQGRDIHLHLADVAHEAPDMTGYEDRCCYDREPMTRHEFARTWHYDRARITLPGADSLPLLHRVQRLSFGEWGRTPDPRVQLELAARMPGLTAVDLVLDASERVSPPLLREDHRSLAEALRVYSEPTRKVAHATLKMLPRGASVVLQSGRLDLTVPQGYDLLGASLRVWSQRLTSFRVRGVVDGSLFWPRPQEEAAGAEPEWPRLQDLDVHAERHAPSGRWYFARSEPAYPAPQPPDYSFESTGDDSNHDEEGRRFSRSVPREETLQPLFAAWARALARMPALRTARLRFRIKFFHEGGGGGTQRWHIMEDWGVVYEAPGHGDGGRNNSNTAWYGMLTPEEKRCRRLVFLNTGGWRPVQETMDLLQAVGADSWPGSEMAVLTVDRDKIVR